MNKFKKPFRSARPSFSVNKRDTRGNGNSEAFQKFDATCSNCGKKCQVPFRPDGAKPVYCKDCFGAPRAEMRKKTFSTRARPTGSIRPAGAQAPEGKSIADLTRQIAAMNTKIDTMLKILETK